MQAKFKSFGFDIEEASWFKPSEQCVFSTYLGIKSVRFWHVSDGLFDPR